MSISMCMCMCMYGLVSGERDYTVRRNGCTRAREYGSTCVRRAFGRSGRPRRRHGAAGGSRAGAAARRRGHIRATEPAARMRGYAAPRVLSPYVRERARVCAARLRPVALAAATALSRRQQRRRCRPAARAHPCHRARRPNARVRSAARAVAVERAPRCRSSPRASKRGAPFAAGVAGGARCDASQAEPRRRRGRSRSLPRVRRSPPIRTRPWRPLRPARTPLSLPEVALERRGES